jgi:hypothetical protein
MALTHGALCARRGGSERRFRAVMSSAIHPTGSIPMRLFRFSHFVAVGLSLIVSTVSAQAQPEPVTVFGAASLKNALEDVAKPFTASTGIQVRFSFAASSALARQIENGAPADLFASADLEWIEYLQQRNIIRTNTRVDLLGNRLVVIAPADSPLLELALIPDPNDQHPCAHSRSPIGRHGDLQT